MANGRKPYDCLWTNENFSLELLLNPYGMGSSAKEFVRNSIKARFKRFGIEATDEQIQQFEANYVYCCKSLGA